MALDFQDNVDPPDSPRREMTLDEWVDRLPLNHSARDELTRLRASLAAVTKERDEARVKADMGELVRLDLKAWYARLKGVPVESVSDMPGLDLTMVIAALTESRLAIAVEALENIRDEGDLHSHLQAEEALRQVRSKP